jgi:hypothetical protein
MRFVSLTVFLLVLAVAGFAGPVGYQFDITTFYQFGGCSDSGLYCANPDTGFLTVTNNGASTFVGDLVLQNVGGTPLVDQLLGITLAPGGSYTLASGDEGSNQGGFGPNGLQFSMAGSVGGGAQAVNLSVFDSQIHSGSPGVSPCDGITTDAFVLQGGSPSGCDNGDAFEVAQAAGHFEFFDRAGGSSVPEPGSVALLGSGLGALLVAMRRKRVVR